jgi:hypothetical protein
VTQLFESAKQNAYKKQNPGLVAPDSLTTGFSWLRGLDLNQRPLGYELEKAFLTLFYGFPSCSCCPVFLAC